MAYVCKQGGFILSTAVFNPRNIDDDCDRIFHLIHPYQVQIGDLLDKGECHEAFSLFYELLESPSYHFVKMNIFVILMICIVLTIHVETYLTRSSRR